jgi:rod shape-determining protein MreD
VRESRLQLFLLSLAALFHPITETWLRPWSLTVDYPFLVLFWIALRRGPLVGTVAGFLLGFLRDLADYSLLGVSSLAYCIGAYGVGAVREKVDREDLPTRMTLLALAYLLTRAIALLLRSDWSMGVAALTWLRYALPESLLCTLVYLIVLIFVWLLGEGARLLHEPSARR